MQENNGFDISIIEKMDGFTIEPSPADWQAIYGRLHPNKKRRAFWWWLPLIGLLTAGSVWLIMENNPGITPPADVSKNKPSRQQNTDADPKATVMAGSPALHQTEISANEAVDKKATIPTSIPEKKKIDKKSSSASTKTRKAITKQRRAYNIHQTSVNPELIQDPAIHNSVATTGNTKQQYPFSEVTKNDSSGLQQYPVSAVTKNDSSSLLQQYPSAVLPKNDSSARQQDSSDSLKKSFASTAIPVKKKEMKWKFSVYIATGTNYPIDPLEIGPKALSSNAPDYNSGASGSSNTYKTLTDQQGWHTAAGVAVTKKLGKNWAYTTGLGISSSRWSTTIETYKDSIFNGGRFTNKLGVESRQQKLWTAEIPLQFSNRIAGRKLGTLWWSIGLNNQFTLSSTQSSDSIISTAMADLRSLHPDTRFYQPQFRLGLLYDYSGKVHWQFQPMAQYGLTSVYKNVSGNNPHLLQLMLQFNLFLSGKKEPARPKR